MNEHAFSWTDERIESLKAMWIDRVSAADIADRLGASSRNAILGKINRLGLSKSRPPVLQRPPRPPRVRRRARFVPPYVREPSAMKVDPAPLPAPSEAYQCTIMDLTNDKCRWVVSTGYPAVFCGAPGCDVDRGVPYCGAHCRLAYDRRRDRGPSPAPQLPANHQHVASGYHQIY